MRILILLLVIISCAKEKEVVLIKQWHLSSQTPTSNIEKAKTLPQFENQFDIYKYLEAKIDEGDLDTVIAEGCEGEIDSSFDKKFNSWTMKDLEEWKDKKEFADIMAPVPMKIAAKHSKVDVVCGDNYKLIQDNLSAASDMRGFFGFYQRLHDYQSDSKKYNAYAEQIFKLFPRHTNIEPMEFSQQKLVESIDRFETFVLKRNKHFIEVIEKTEGPFIYVVIGGLHVQDLEKQLRDKGIKVSVYTPKGYKDDEQGLMNRMKNIFLSQKSYDLFLVPEKFDLHNFPISQLIESKKMANSKELAELTDLADKNKLDKNIISSDFDKDGIRDFTFSTYKGRLIISPEDQDWDNDGIHNLLDDTVGKTLISQISKKLPLANNYLSQSDIGEAVKKLKTKIKLVQSQGYYHEFLVLEILLQMISKKVLPTQNVKILRSASFKQAKGRNTFFNYVKVARTLNYDPKKLNKFLNDEYQKRFKDAEFKSFINSYAIPLIIHSLAHEIGHSLDFDIEEFARSNGWSWKDTEVKSSYLRNNREEVKKLSTIKTEVQYQGKTFKQWLNLSKQKPDNLFLKLQKIPSLYALSSPEEWFAEVYSMCKFAQVFPKSRSQLDSERLEKLMGINPSSVSPEICLNF